MADRIPPYEQRHMDAAEKAIRDKTRALDGMGHVAACVLLATALADIEELSYGRRIVDAQGARPSLRIVFSTIAGRPDLVFVEVEDEHGASIDIGVWTPEGQGRRVLTIPASEETSP